MNSQGECRAGQGRAGQCNHSYSSCVYPVCVSERNQMRIFQENNYKNKNNNNSFSLSSSSQRVVMRNYIFDYWTQPPRPSEVRPRQQPVGYSFVVVIINVWNAASRVRVHVIVVGWRRCAGVYHIGRTDGRKEGQTEETYQFTIELLQLLGSGGRAELRRAQQTNVN